MIKEYKLYACDLCEASFSEWEDSDAKKQAEEHEKIPLNPTRLQNNGVYRWIGKNPNSGKFIGVVNHPVGMRHIIGGPKHKQQFEEQHAMDYDVTRFYIGGERDGHIEDCTTSVVGVRKISKRDFDSLVKRLKTTRKRIESLLKAEYKNYTLRDFAVGRISEDKLSIGEVLK